MKDWKTTLAGLLAGAAQLVASGMNWKAVLAASAVAAMGVVAKDTAPEVK